MQEFNQLTPHPGQFRKFRQPEGSWEKQNGLTGGGYGMAAMDSHGGDIFESVDPEERGGALGDMWIAQIGSMSEARLLWSAVSAWSAAPRVTHGHRIWLNSLLWYLPAVLTRSI